MRFQRYADEYVFSNGSSASISDSLGEASSSAETAAAMSMTIGDAGEGSGVFDSVLNNITLVREKVRGISFPYHNQFMC